MWQALIDNSGAVIAVFTAILAATTIVYVVVSMKLLKQSKNALLADITLRVIEIWRRGINKIRKKEEATEIKAWMEGYRGAFIKIDKRLGMDITKLIEVCLDTMLKEWGKGKKEEET